MGRWLIHTCPFGCDQAEVLWVSAYRLHPTTKGGIYNMHGENIEYGPIQASVIPRCCYVYSFLQPSQGGSSSYSSSSSAGDGNHGDRGGLPEEKSELTATVMEGGGEEEGHDDVDDDDDDNEYGIPRPYPNPIKASSIVYDK